MTLMRVWAVTALAGVLCGVRRDRGICHVIGQAYRVGGQLSQNASLTAHLFPARSTLLGLYIRPRGPNRMTRRYK